MRFLVCLWLSSALHMLYFLRFQVETDCRKTGDKRAYVLFRFCFMYRVYEESCMQLQARNVHFKFLFFMKNQTTTTAITVQMTRRYSIGTLEVSFSSCKRYIPSAPSIHPSVELIISTEFSQAAVGLVTLLQLVPSQCIITPSDPTAQPST